MSHAPFSVRPRRALLLALAASSSPAFAEDAPNGDILVVAQKQTQTIENAPATRATVDAATLATQVNAINVEDSIKYLPSLIVRKRHIGDTQAPLATRTSGLGSSARSLIYADGALLSALIGNNNTSASPRWSLVSPQEIARIDVLYGPFSAAYPGNSIGAVVNITTRLPDALEATLQSGVAVQAFDQYGTHQTLPSWQVGGTIGDRFGPLALFASEDHVASRAQPLLYVTATLPGASAAGVPTTGGYAALNRTGAPITVLGASGSEHQVQEHIKLKAALDLTPSIRITYVGGLFLNSTHASAQTYLADAGGNPVYAGSLNIGGRLYTVAPSAFSGGVYSYDERHWSHALSASGTARHFDWQVIGTLYDFAHDVQRSPTTALPGGLGGGAGTITRLDGTGWRTLDAKAAWREGAHAISFGAHYDRFEIDSNRYTTDNWIDGAAGALNLQSRGRTRTAAVWGQDAWRLADTLTLTLGGRQEWWRAYDGVNFSAAPAIAANQPTLSASRFSPKASLAWEALPGWTARLSFGEAFRFPTVSELYQIVTTPPLAAVPNPNLRPERALSEELALEHRDDRGTMRVSFFNESVKDALISQTGTLTALSGAIGAATFVQNVDRTRVRGIELAGERRDLLPGVDLSGSLTYADGTTRKDTAFPNAVGKLLPQVPHWKATLVGTWRPVERLSLTAAARLSSRLYGTLDNSDIVGNTYMGFYKYLVADLRATYRLTDHLTAAVGIDNVGNDQYFLFHPFPQRSYTAELTFKL